jgi:hypothetical protein
MESYSQCGQDLFVYNLTKGQKGKFLDLGCYLPKKINNTYLLELNGWEGVSIDINDYSNEWKVRNSLFIQEDCFKIEYEKLLKEHFQSQVIDYLSLDMEDVGDRYRLLEKILKTNYEFKIITIEHDSHLGIDYIKNEREPQRELLKNNGYRLVCADVSQKDYPNLFYEDWWINTKFFLDSEINNWVSEKMSCDKIFNKLNITYNVNKISQTW